MVRFKGFYTEDEAPEQDVILSGTELFANRHAPKRGTEKPILELFPEYGFVILASITKLKVWSLFGVPGLINWNRMLSQTPRIIYIQNLNKSWGLPWTYLFIVDENRKWGLVNCFFKTLIEPQYDSMEWFKKGKLIEVLKDSKRYIVDINNNICI